MVDPNDYEVILLNKIEYLTEVIQDLNSEYIEKLQTKAELIHSFLSEKQKLKDTQKTYSDIQRTLESLAQEEIINYPYDTLRSIYSTLQSQFTLLNEHYKQKQLFYHETETQWAGQYNETQKYIEQLQNEKHIEKQELQGEISAKIAVRNQIQDRINQEQIKHTRSLQYQKFSLQNQYEKLNQELENSKTKYSRKQFELQSKLNKEQSEAIEINQQILSLKKS